MSVETIAAEGPRGLCCLWRGRDSIRSDWEWEYAAHLKATHGQADWLGFTRSTATKRALLRSSCAEFCFVPCASRQARGCSVGPEVIVKHPETMEFGNAVFIGAQTMIQGRFDGTCRIGNHVWIGPHAYFDARDLILEDYVGWGPGAKVLGSSHTGAPIELPIIATPLKIKQVVVGYGADIGTNATLFPGVHIGAHSIVGAGAVVTEDVPEYAIVAGIPAEVIRFRK